MDKREENMTVKDLLKNPERKFNEDELAALAAAFRLESWIILHQCRTGHWGGTASAMELTTCLYFNRLNIRIKNPDWEDRDRFILSKGHASMNLYTVLAHRGFFPVETLPTFRALGSNLQGHPAMNKTAGVDMSTGALGHGLSIGLGMALAAKLSGKKYWTFVMTGEGCLNEGQSWEALMCAAKYRPERLVLLVDYNKVQLDGTEDEVMPMEPLCDKLVSFGWNVCPQSFDGNNTADILRSFEWLDYDGFWPKAVVYNTVKGKGVSFTEGKSAWHGMAIDDENYNRGLPELKADLEKKEAGL